MISRRLTKIEKIEILKEFLSGLTANNLAKKYNCSANTINRTVKTLLTNDEYKSLKEERSKMKRIKIKESRSEVSSQDIEAPGFDKGLSKDYLGSKNDKLKHEESANDIGQNFILETNNLKSLPIENNSYLELDSNSQEQFCESNFEEIVPLITTLGFETQDQSIDCQNLDKVTLPESVYMLVDKKVELEPQPISELPEWSFLPENEIKRLAILLFPNQRTAKRNCSRSQRVIKIPNTSIFEISKTYLLARGITRLILEDSLISLEN